MHGIFQTMFNYCCGVGMLRNHCILLASLAWLLAGCVAKVEIPAVDQFHIAADVPGKSVARVVDGNVLLNNLYELLRANEGVEVPVCTAEKDSRQCIKDGFSVFVLGGPIPGLGGRSRYMFSKTSINDTQVKFTKDNGSTTFIGTPMYAAENESRVFVKDGGLAVEMDRYYATWMGMGQMFMAEGWAIDYMDLRHGVVGLQLELDIKGVFTIGGGSRYILLKFPNVPESLSK